MIYRITVDEGLMQALKDAGAEEVRSVLYNRFNVLPVPFKRGRPKKGHELPAEPKKIVPKIKNHSTIKEIEPELKVVPELPKESTISKEERIRLGVEKIAREKAERQALQKAKQMVNHDPPVEADELPPPEL